MNAGQRKSAEGESTPNAIAPARLPCACLLNGQYGFEGLYMGVPAILGAKGVEKIVELPLDSDARILMQKTAGAVAADVQLMRDMKLF